MKPAGIAGLLLIIGGAIVLILRGVPFVKDRDKVDLGVVEVTTEEKGFIPPIAGVIAIGVGAVLLFAARRGKA